MKEPKPMQEIHEIRHQMYEESKNLSWEEWVKKMHQTAEETIRKYGLKIRQTDKAA